MKQRQKGAPHEQGPDEGLDVGGHVRGLGAAGRQLNQSHQEVLALFHILQGLL